MWACTVHKVQDQAGKTKDIEVSIEQDKNRKQHLVGKFHRNAIMINQNVCKRLYNESMLSPPLMRLVTSNTLLITLLNKRSLRKPDNILSDKLLNSMQLNLDEMHQQRH